MKTYRKKIRWITYMLLAALLGGGCGQSAKTEPNEPVQKVDLGAAIGSLADVFSYDSIPVEGYALVGGLNSTGSSDCPQAIRMYLIKYIQQQFPDQKINADEFINSSNTAVVHLSGMMPAAVSKNQYFDVKVTALQGTQTTSLEGGILWGAELVEAGRFGISLKPLAKAEGPVFIDTIGTPETDKKTGYILGGGKVLDEYKMKLVLRRPDFRISNAVRNRLNERFGERTAKAVSATQVDLEVPAKYGEQKQRFIAIVKATFLAETPQLIKERTEAFVQKLSVSDGNDNSEVALEAIGNECLSSLSKLLNSPNERVRLRTGRCMLNLGSDLGLKTLREIALDKNSAYRIEALDAIAVAAARNDLSAVSVRLLRDENFDIRLAAYEHLRKLDDIAISQKLIGNNFFLEQIQPGTPAIFVARSGQPRIVLFGAPIYCRDNIFVQSANGNITVNAPAGQKYVSIIRKHPKRPNIIQVKSTFELSDIIQTLCEAAVVKDNQARPGLGVSYPEVIALLKQLCEQGAVQAEFRVGPLPKISL